MDLPEGVRTYELECRFGEPIAVHVVETATDTVLFGGGDESTRERYVEIVEAEAPDVIVVEHGDPDHYGSLPALAGGSEAPTIAVPAGDADSLREANVEPDVLLEPDVERWGITTIGVPGHTPDNMAYLHRDILIAGDTVAGTESAFAAEGDWSGPLAVIIEDYNHDDAQTRENVRLLLEHDFQVVLVTHGSNVLENGRAAVETLVDDLNV